MNGTESSITMKSVSRRVGISVSTVSRALSKPEMVSKKTRTKVQSAVQALGYKPNFLARNLRKSETRLVTVIVTTTANSFYTDIIRGVENVAHDHGYCVLLGETGDDLRRKTTYSQLFSTRRVDGLIALTTDPLPPAFVASLKQENTTPIVLVCERHDRLRVPTVTIDDIAAARMAVEYLIKLGHRRVACIAGPRNHAVTKDRLRGYRQALSESGIQFSDPLIRYGDFVIGSGICETEKLLALQSPPTAIFAFNDEMAFGAVRAVRTRGLRIPRDISVMGFDDSRYAAFADPPLTTIAQPKLEIGRKAMEILCKILNKEPDVAQSTVLDVELVVRQSCGQAHNRT